MIAPLTRIDLGTIILVVSWLISLQSAIAADDLSQSSRVGALRIPLSSYERIPIGTVLAHPDRFQMRELRLVGTVRTIQTEIILNRQICGRSHEKTTLTVEDDTGTIEVIDQGACGRNVGSLKGPMLKVGQQIDLLALLILSTSDDRARPSLEVTIRFLDISSN